VIPRELFDDKDSNHLETFTGANTNMYSKNAVHFY